MRNALPISRQVLGVWLLCLFSSLTLQAQNTISGTVTDGENNETLPGVNVLVKGTTIGTITDVEGKYSISVPDDAETLVFSSVGFTAEEVAISNRSSIDMVMMPDIQSLSEVVVVGYGTQDSRDVTAAIASVSAEDIEKIPVASGVEAIQGQVAGVDILSSGGRPGQAPSIRIRGRRSITASNDPLFVIDGIPQTSGTSAIFDINPQDIESMEILKDAASTAVYGSRGANGVVLITTKRGEPGETKVTYNGYYGVTDALITADMMNGEEFAAMKRESRRWNPETRLVDYQGVFPADELVFEDPVELESIAQGRSTDFQDLVLQQGFQTNHQLSVRGGTEKTQYGLSLGYFNEEGVISSLGFERINGTITLDHQINDVFKIGLSSIISTSTQDFGNGSVMQEALANNPLGVPFDEDGNIRFLPTNDGIRTNPLSELVEDAFIDERKATRIFSPVYLEAKIANGLTFKSTFGPDIRFTRRGFFAASETNANRGGPASSRVFNEQEIGYTLENLLTWEQDFDRHDIKVNLLQSIQSRRFEGYATQVLNLPYESQLFYNQGTAEVKGDIFSGLATWQLASFMGRVTYKYNDKYNLQLTMRADGSSRLAEGNKWSLFPGISAGWRISDEPFLQNSDFVQELKLRGSFGLVGNTSVGPYQTFGRLFRTTYAWDESPAFGYRLAEIPNPNLGWETTSETNIGLDYGFFNGRVFGSIDVFRAFTNDLLLDRNLPFTSGYNNILQNVGTTRTQGVELFVAANILNTSGGFRWNASFNAARIGEEITELALRDENGNPVNDLGNAWFAGQPIKVFFDYEKEGIYQLDEEDLARDREQKLPGEIKIKDQDGDGVITPDDRVVIGTDLPDIMGGLTNSFDYKGFSFSFFFYYRLGHTIRSRFHDSNNSLFARYNNLDVDYWTVDNPTNAFPRPNQNQERPRDASSMSYFDGSYVKLRNVTLGYTFPESMTSKLGLGNVRLYASGQNLWFWSKFDAFDPEVSDQDNDNISAIGSGTIPTARLFLLGVSAQFISK
ncbi:SusC/RagA family TonB-linked outer membrane protein [Tunicatimonas pelagia]|uniref:SusC/RagA family TonB-linked outer membrane protein n=1 Tax=Tunicatimonas pelagia TaxID=931531 RepID=UPI002666CCC7|nr:TonB-dependent receptor [Tunicatimonas pelagia]WKN42852.1 TonB-dependent receptor [Tunicatimonas pelagia]